MVRTRGNSKRQSPDSPPSNKGFQTPSNPATPLTPTTPSTPATPASMSDETDKSSFSISIDSGIESPPNMCQLPDDKMSNLVSIRNIASRTQRHASATDHTTKEKLRRERIKESCDQLRVLLPYIRGRKTDMASILEMCVDYLQIVNAAMPQSLQDQIVDLLSREGGQYVIQAADVGAGKKNTPRDVKQLPSPILNMASSLTGVKDENRARCVTPDFYSRLKKATPDVNISPFNAGRSVPMTTQISSKRDVTGTLDNLSGAKRLRLNGDVLQSDRPDDISSQGQIASPNIGISTSFENVSSGTSRDDQGTMTYSFYSPQLNQSHTKVYTDMENAFTRMYNVHSTAESFPSGQLFNSFTTSTSKQLDRDASATTTSPYNIYMDNSLYQYYGSTHSGVNSHLYNNPDYVNPNSVLPVSYNSSRMKSEKEMSAEEIGANDADVSFPETP
ncbi:hypothetical protein CHS0354_020385 [Potamilus streckersoni]|uniref:BHLH domain-containing protein n=1 Tax=Potamilus streckersoni TaxID=2493646 RepID=A0AAE0WCR9_9BIVA|nr:hypothetical protein CHS0354_020385 [Potamilus streckersoni]